MSIDFSYRWLLRHGKNASAESSSKRPPSSESDSYGHFLTLDVQSPAMANHAAASAAAPTPLKPESSGAYLVSRSGERGIDNPAVIDLSDESNRHSGHQDPRCWLLPDLARVEAERRLFNKLDGTFLIRRSAAGSAPYALSIAYRGVEKGVGHILIHRSERGYGFAEPYLHFPTLNDLVHYYATNSLEEHNPQLTTTLAHPILAPQSASESHYVVNNWYSASLSSCWKFSSPKKKHRVLCLRTLLYNLLWFRQLKLCKAILCGHLWYLFCDWKVWNLDERKMPTTLTTSAKSTKRKNKNKNKKYKKKTKQKKNKNIKQRKEKYISAS